LHSLSFPLSLSLSLALSYFLKRQEFKKNLFSLSEMRELKSFQNPSSNFIYGCSHYYCWAKLPKNSLKECVFVNSALKIQCYIVKNTFLQTAYCWFFVHRFQVYRFIFTFLTRCIYKEFWLEG